MPPWSPAATAVHQGSGQPANNVRLGGVGIVQQATTYVAPWHVFADQDNNRVSSFANYQSPYARVRGFELRKIVDI